jgi:hypothetical protein
MQHLHPIMRNPNLHQLRDNYNKLPSSLLQWKSEMHLSSNIILQQYLLRN